jgi:hypothetical protein
MNLYPNGIRTYDPGVRAVENSEHPRICCHCVVQILKYGDSNFTRSFVWVWRDKQIAAATVEMIYTSDGESDRWEEKLPAVTRHKMLYWSNEEDKMDGYS